MSPRVQPIFTDNPGSLPATYTLPAGLDLVLSSVVARFNGAAAAAAFLPCLSIYTQDGKLMARVRPDQEFAVGDTGVVTYAPFLRRAAAAAPSGAYAPDYQIFSFGPVSTSAAGPSTIALSNDSGPNLGTHFTLAGGNVSLIAAGLYRYDINVVPAGFAAGDTVIAQIGLPGTLGGNWGPGPTSGGSPPTRDSKTRFSNPNGVRMQGIVGMDAGVGFPIATSLIVEIQDAGFNPKAVTINGRVVWSWYGAL